MKKGQMKNLYEFYKHVLFDDCIPFWLENSLDGRYGGFITCLDQQGKVYNTDKSVWFQGRSTWLFSRLYNTVDKKREWIEAAKSGYDFLLKYCFDSDRRMFFIVTQDGKPLQKRRYMFCETFAIIACAEYYRASGDKTALLKAREIYDMVVDLYKTPGRLIPKINPDVRSTRSLSLPMILLTTTLTLIEADSDRSYDSLAKMFTDDILKYFFKPSQKALFETVGPNGERLDLPQGRCINPGHSIETAWFLMHQGIYRNDKVLINSAEEILSYSLEIGWDSIYGGLLYFIDIEGKPAEQLEWDMKLWWPHTEALYATLLAYYLTGKVKYSDWFKKVNDWAFSHFSDEENGEWFGYLHRDGSVANTLKGSLWKGAFHLPRALLLCIRLLEKMIG